MKKISLLVYGLFCLGTANAQFADLHDFATGNPQGSLTFSVTGDTLFGMTKLGGIGAGNIFSINKDGSGYRQLHSFTGPADGEFPVGNLTLSGNILYGMTPYHCTIFSIHTDGSGFKVLSTNINSSPKGSLTLLGGKFYGTSSTQSGSVFSVDTNGSGYKTLYTFPFNAATSGVNLNGSLTPSVTGDTLFGMVTYGSSLYGNIFCIHTDGSGYTDMFDFDTLTGASPRGSLILYNGLLYGMTNYGGLYGGTSGPFSGGFGGTIFSIHTDGSGFTVLVNAGAPAWSSNSSGQVADCSLAYGSLTVYNGLLYGMTSAASSEYGNVFSVHLDGSGYAALWEFYQYPIPGGTPHGDVVISGNMLYGMVGVGNGAGEGFIFADTLLNTTASVVANVSSSGDSDGIATANPAGGILPPTGDGYTYLWSDPNAQTNDTAIGLTAGTYTVTVNDWAGSVVSATVTISTNSILPIELLNFDAQAVGASAKLTWTTATETNNNYFTVMRSKDGVNWENIGTVKGAGNSDNMLYYYFIDDNASNRVNGNGTLYYRISQTDFDGKSEKFNVKDVTFQSSISSLEIYPNPVTNYLNIRLKASNNIISVQVINAMGQIVYAANQLATNGGISTSQFTEGTYLLRIITATNAYQQKFIKIESK
ncbi:MAG TPA: choice-of-anchor tandem repeat GloVer-containing protein [Bacteroidia bacterium]|nr:choice-of-anchor tandem repeat GloVer-containing protein [Bacteroidia bacterium]